MSDEITCRIQRAELVGLLHESAMPEPQRITARMPVVTLTETLSQLLEPDELPPPLAIRFRPQGTHPMPRIDGDDAVVSDEVDPEVSVAIDRGRQIEAAIEAAIDAAVDHAAEQAVLDAIAEDERVTAVIAAEKPESFAMHFVPMALGFLATFAAGIGIMAWIL